MAIVRGSTKETADAAAFTSRDLRPENRGEFLRGIFPVSVEHTRWNCRNRMVSSRGFDLDRFESGKRGITSIIPPRRSPGR